TAALLQEAADDAIADLRREVVRQLRDQVRRVLLRLELIFELVALHAVEHGLRRRGARAEPERERRADQERPVMSPRSSHASPPRNGPPLMVKPSVPLNRRAGGRWRRRARRWRSARCRR